MLKKVTLSIVCLLLTCTIFCQERFLRWDDNITINKDGTINVQEKIEVQTEGKQFKRGLWRSFPTRYADMFGLQYIVGFNVAEIKRDGVREYYSIVDRINGKQIYIGDPKKRLSSGLHTFLISYTSNRQLGFFNDRDELYYNVVGNDVGFVVDKATARVQLPSNVPRDKISFEAYTGYFGQKNKNYNVEMLDDGTVFFETTNSLLPKQAFTIVVSWPKGYVNEPSIWLKIFWFVRDNVSHLFLLFGLLILLLFYVWAYRKTRRGFKEGVVIPIFYPPANHSPGSIRYLVKKLYDFLGLTSDIVDMAVKGLLTIEHKKKTFWKGGYSLKTNEESNVSEYCSYYMTIFHTLQKKSPVVLNQSNRKIIQSISKTARNHYKDTMNKYIIFNRGYLGAGFAISLLFLALGYLFAQAFVMGAFLVWLAIYIAIAVGIHSYMYLQLPLYTQVGQKIYNEIQGFKLFLATAETDRLKVIGTPPTKTPQLWEEYLPYAIALGVEKQWSEQFAPIFARLEKDGSPYTPLWYVGSGRFRATEAAYFASGLRKSFNTAITSASQHPGVSSGGGGRGSAGGGGGGGGAGGW